jgi:hypothetical protein
VRRIGYLALGLQFAALLVWSAILWSRFTQTNDFAVYHQVWYLIAHGDLYPFATAWGHYFARGDSEYLLWLIAPFYWIWPHDIVQLWLQDACISGAELVAFAWICELAGRIDRRRTAPWLAVTGLILLVANPWIWWTASFDFHIEPMVIPFVVLLAKDLVDGRRRAWIWAFLIIVSGAQVAVYVAGAGLGAMLVSRRARLSGALMAGLSVGYSLVILLLHVNQGAPVVQDYGYLAGGDLRTLTFPGMMKGIALHPLRPLGVLWSKRVDLLANLLPSGLLGIFDVTVLPLILIVVLESFLFPGVQIAEPIFQNIPIYIVLPVGTVAVLCRLAGRHRRIALLLAGVIVVQCFGWTFAWGSRTSFQWLKVPSSAAATLSAVRARIPGSAEVIAGQGVNGAFSDRKYIYQVSWPGTYLPVKRKDVWFVITPLVGIQTLTTAAQMDLISELAGPLQARLVVHENGIWVFRWHPPEGVYEVRMPGIPKDVSKWDQPAPLAAWASPGAAGRDMTSGPVGDWHVSSTGDRGYVVEGLAWQMAPGEYRAYVTMSASGPVNMEVWNDTPGNAVLLARRHLTAIKDIESVAMPVNATKAYSAHAYPGWGIFRANFVTPFPGERLEVRVWSPGAERINVYQADLVPAGGGR